MIKWKRKILQFVPFDVVEEALVRAHSFGLDWFKQVLAIVGEGTHQEVLLITETANNKKLVVICPQLISCSAEYRSNQQNHCGVLSSGT